MESSQALNIFPRMGDVGVLIEMILVGRENTVIPENGGMIQWCPLVGERGRTNGRTLAFDRMNCARSLVTGPFAADVGQWVNLVLTHV